MLVSSVPGKGGWIADGIRRDNQSGSLSRGRILLRMNYNTENLHREWASMDCGRSLDTPLQKGQFIDSLQLHFSQHSGVQVIRSLKEVVLSSIKCHLQLRSSFLARELIAADVRELVLN